MRGRIEMPDSLLERLGITREQLPKLTLGKFAALIHDKGLAIAEVSTKESDDPKVRITWDLGQKADSK